MTKLHPFESPYLYGLHDAGGEYIMQEMGIPGWVVVSEPIGYDPNNHAGRDFSELINKGMHVIVRLNAGYAGVGTVPFEKHHGDFARRCANFVAATPGVHMWIIGNEPNHPIEWPGADWDWGTAQPRSPETAGEKLTPKRYAHAYLLARNAIHQLPGHEHDLVLTAAIAPWNALCIYPGNPTGDWLIYMRDMLRALGPNRCDGITIHAYTHGADSSLVDSEKRMQAPYERHHYEFRVYQDFMNAIPWYMRHLPVYLTETDQNEPWRNENIDWVKRAYGEIDYWNKLHPFRPIRNLILYRWSKSDHWYIDGKQGVIEDFRESMIPRYRWNAYQEKAPAYRSEIHILRIPDGIHTGETFTIPLAIRNIGSMVWPRGGEHPVHVGYRWLDAKGKQVVAPDYRTALPHNVTPGSWVRVKAQIGAPETAGDYILAIDLVHEGVTWFGDRKSRVARRKVAITNIPKPSPLDAVWKYLQKLKKEQDPFKLYYQEDPGPSAEPLTFVGQLAGGEVITVPKPAMMEVVDLLPRREPAPKDPDVPEDPDAIPDHYQERELSQITHITVHHSAAPGTILPSRVAQYHVYSKSHLWPGIGYHFYIMPDGTIYHTQDMHLISWHVYRNNSYTVGVCLAGNFTDVVPPPNQLDASARLIAWLMQELHIPPEYVLGHKEFPKNATACPGRQWDHDKHWKDMLMSAIEDVRTGERTVTPKTLKHYVLFWKHGADWAREDWLGAAEYVARFDAAAGFSEEEAHQAELVTIIGGPAGVSPAVEARLREDGCQVQRIAGKTTKETAALLHKQVDKGHPLLKY